MPLQAARIHAVNSAVYKSAKGLMVSVSLPLDLSFQNAEFILPGQKVVRLCWPTGTVATANLEESLFCITRQIIKPNSRKLPPLP